MHRKILTILPITAAAIVLVTMSLGVSTEDDSNNAPSVHDSDHSVSIVMSSSRPGCESTNACYVPSEIAISRSESVTWTNDDSAFHTVTSGYYDESDGLFDSQQLDPSQKFSYVFSELGQFHYYCKLHPWMEGKITVN